MSEGKGSIFVISDCHLGLIGKEKGIVSEPEHVGQFLNWLIHLKEGEPFKIKLGPWGNGRKEKVLKPPERLLLIGDILELWDAPDRGIEFCTRPIWELLAKLDCPKVYILGNHDYDLKPLLGTYPSGDYTLTFIEDYYPTQVDENGKKIWLPVKMGDRDYIFVHGYQFDKLFSSIAPWKKLGSIRSGALAFGDYGDIFVALLFLSIVVFIFNYVITMLSPLTFPSTITSLVNFMFPYLQFIMPSFLGVPQSIWSMLYPYLAVVGNLGLIVLWLLIGGPRWFYLYARKIWNRLVGTRYNRKDSINGINRWWNGFAKGRNIKGKDIRIVYGHTHLIDIIDTKDIEEITHKKVNITAINIPSWVKDYTEKHRQKLRATCLYIDDEDEMYIGWDWTDRKHFLVPEDVVNDEMSLGYIKPETGKKLLSIDWPKALVDTWTTKWKKL
jgi:hypothetical protein